MKTVVAFVILVLASTSSSLLAQTTDGSIRGFVRDEQGGSMPGVTVTAVSADAPRPHAAVSDSDGLYRLLNLPPGTYTLTAEIQGFSKLERANVVVRAGLNLSVDLVMQLGTVNETIQVVGETPLLEATKAVQAVNVSGEMQQALPLGAQKHWSEFLRFSPGAISRDATVNQAPVFYVHGSGITSSSTLIDGADMTSAINPWAGYAALPADTIADVQIKTSGLDASAPLGMGVAANVVTKSGTNAFKGSASITYSPSSWIGNNVPGGSAESSSLLQPDLALGGPIQRDKWWFFGSYRYRSGTFGIGRQADQVSDMQALEPGFDPFDNEIGANILFVKATGQLNPNQQLSAFFNRDASPYDSNGGFDTGRFRRTIIGGKGYSARLNSSWSDRLTSRLAFSWNDKSALTKMVNPSLMSRPVFRTAFLSSGQLVGATQRATLDNIASATESPYTKWTITGDTTFYKSGWLGSHELQAGVFLQPHMTREDVIVHANGGASIEEHVFRDPANPAAGTIPFHRRIYDEGSGLLAKGHFADNAVYVQDTWRPTDRFTVTAGLRFDHVTRNDDLFTMELQNSWEFGPRVGVNYQLTGDQRNAVRASYMRVHEAPNINALSASGAGSQGSGAQTIGFRDLYDLDFDGNFESVFATPAASPVSPNRVLDSAYHQPYVEEWAMGYRRQLRGQASIDVGYLHRNYKDRTALVEQNAIYNGAVFEGYRNPAQNEIFLVTNNEWNWPVYRALELVFTKQTARFQTVASYTRVWPYLAGTWQPNDPASFIQPDAFHLDRGLGSNDNRSASPNDSLSTTATPSSIEWTEQVARASGVYRAPWNFLFSASYTLQKGRWSGPVLARVASADPQFGPSTVRLPNGRVVSNPLATTLRFAHPTRSEGQFQLPGLHYINLRVGREFPFGDRRFVVNVDFFNLPNMGSFQGFLTGANQLFSTNYGRGGEIQPPRSVQLELRFIF
jgi:outer membrane receptor protein involved in Fe transport